MVFFGHRRGVVHPPPPKSRNYLFLGKIFKFKGGSGPPVPPSGSAHDLEETQNIVFGGWCMNNQDTNQPVAGGAACGS